MSQVYIDLWNQFLDRPGKGDLIASISFDAINHILKEHHKEDRDRYKTVIERAIGPQANGRKFILTVDIAKPLQMAYESTPSKFVESDGWLKLPGPHPLDGSGVTKPGESPVPNLHISIPAISLSLSWPKVSGQGIHEWKPKDLMAEVAAYVTITRHEDRVLLTVAPTMVKFDYQPVIAASNTECEEKFSDLLLIALNEFSVELLPKLVRSVEVPAVEVKSISIQPTSLGVTPDHVTVGVVIDAEEHVGEVARRFDVELGAFNHALEMDMEAAGGWRAIVVDEVATDESGDIVLRSEGEANLRLPRTRAYMESLGHRAANQVESRPVSEKLTEKRGRNAIPLGMGVCFSEYFATSIASASLPGAKFDCSKEERILDMLKGKVCSWSSITNARITFQQAAIHASVDVDFGGKLVACVKKAWDCSWRWDCHDYGLSFVGRPKITARLLSDSSGVRVACKIDIGNIRPVADLPFPFDKVVEFFLQLVLKFVQVILDIVSLGMSFVAIPVKFQLPEQKTQVALSRFNGFPYQAPQHDTDPARSVFIGHTASVKAS